MEAFCKEGFSSLAFRQVGDADQPAKAAVDATRDEIKRFWEVGNEEAASIQGIKEVGDAAGHGNTLFCDGREADDKLLCEVGNAPVYAFGSGFHEVGDVKADDSVSPKNAPVYAFGNGFHEGGNVKADDSVSPTNAPVYAFGNDFHGVGDVEADNWVSPRISFSQDFFMPDIDPLSQSTPGRISSETKKGEHDIKDNYSAEFAFLKDGPSHGAPDQAKGFMLSADELFFDGKLLPLPFPNIWAAADDLSLPSSCDMHRQEAVQKSHNRPMSRHLSFEIPKPSSSSTSSTFSMRSATCPCVSSPCKNSRLDTSLAYSDACVRFSLSLPSSPSPSSSLFLLSSPPLPSSPSSMSLPPTSPAPSPSPSLPSILPKASTSLLPSSSVTKCSTKLKDLFKSKKNSKDSSPSQLTRDNGVTATRRLPISSRSFWPFSRSNSAGVSKSTAHPPLPCRSNSAGESHTCDAPSLKDLDVIDVARLSTSSSVEGSTKEQGLIPTLHGENSQTPEFTVPLEVASAEENSNIRIPSSHGADTSVDTAGSMTMSENVTSLGFRGHSKASGKKVIGTPGKGSPGKRKGVSSSSGVKYGGKVVLRNLERCSAEKKLGRDGWRALHRRGSFPVGARVSPVLNVAVCRGPSTPKIGLFRFNSLLFSKKEKPAEAAINWRNEA